MDAYRMKERFQRLITRLPVIALLIVCLCIFPLSRGAFGYDYQTTTYSKDNIFFSSVQYNGPLGFNPSLDGGVLSIKYHYDTPSGSLRYMLFNPRDLSSSKFIIFGRELDQWEEELGEHLETIESMAVNDSSEQDIEDYLVEHGLMGLYEDLTDLMSHFFSDYFPFNRSGARFDIKGNIELKGQGRSFNAIRYRGNDFELVYVPFCIEAQSNDRLMVDIKGTFRDADSDIIQSQDGMLHAGTASSQNKSRLLRYASDNWAFSMLETDIKSAVSNFFAQSSYISTDDEEAIFFGKYASISQAYRRQQQQLILSRRFMTAKKQFKLGLGFLRSLTMNQYKRSGDSTTNLIHNDELYNHSNPFSTTSTTYKEAYGLALHGSFHRFTQSSNDLLRSSIDTQGNTSLQARVVRGYVPYDGIGLTFGLSGYYRHLLTQQPVGGDLYSLGNESTQGNWHGRMIISFNDNPRAVYPFDYYDFGYLPIYQDRFTNELLPPGFYLIGEYNIDSNAMPYLGWYGKGKGIMLRPIYKDSDHYGADLYLRYRNVAFSLSHRYDKDRDLRQVYSLGFSIRSYSGGIFSLEVDDLAGKGACYLVSYSTTF